MAQETAPKKRKKKRRMRLPNGMGSVHKIGGDRQRRRPWRARVPSHVEFNLETGKAVQKFITVGYFETEMEAIEALMEYRKNPYTLEAATCTFEDVYEMWSAKKYPELSYSGQRGYIASFKSCESIHKMKMRDIRAIHLEGVMNEIQGKHQTQLRLKTFWGQLFKYAMEHDIIQKDYSEFVKTRDKDEGTKRTAIPPEDREKIWRAIDEGDTAAELAMIYIYTGMRASELLEMKKENVDMENRILVGGLKTAAGQNRRIPIHKCIMPFMERLMQTEGEYLISQTRGKTSKPMSYQNLKATYWIPLMERLGTPQYTLHYCRHTCATMMREVDIPEDIRKLILGHANGDITDRYTHHTDAMLLEAMDKVKGR